MKIAVVLSSICLRFALPCYTIALSSRTDFGSRKAEMMVSVPKRALLACLPSTLLFVVGCATPETGPSLVVEVIDRASGNVLTVGEVVPRTMLEPTTGDPNLCCCRAVGRAENRSIVTIHASLRFEAFRRSPGGEQPAGIALEFLRDLPAGQGIGFAADGLLFPCATIERLVLNKIDVTGLFFP